MSNILSDFGILDYENDSEIWETETIPVETGTGPNIIFNEFRMLDFINLQAEEMWENTQHQETDGGPTIFNRFEHLNFSMDEAIWKSLDVSEITIVELVDFSGLCILVEGEWKVTSTAQVLISNEWKNIVSVQVLVDGSWRSM